MSKLPYVTLNHYTPAGFQTQDVVLKEEAEKLEAENTRLRKALLGESRIPFEASDIGEWVREDDALAEIARLRAALERIFNEVTTGPHYQFSDVGIIAQKALEGTNV